jgi:homoserine kinase type II
LPDEGFDFKGVAMGTVNTYYRISYSDHKIFYLKIDEVGNLARLQNELLILNNLRRQQSKLPFQMPFPLKTLKGKFFVKLGKKAVLIFPEVKGQIIFENKLDSSLLKKIGKALAHLHRIKIDPTIKPHRFSPSGQAAVFKQIRKKLAQKHPALLPFVQNKVSSLKLDQPKRETTVLIHADLFAENIHWTGKQLNGILDFEAAGAGSPLFDLCVCFHALCHDKTGFNRRKIKAFLNGYQSVRELSGAEKKLFWYYLNQTSLRFLLTRLRDFELVDGDVKAEPFKDYREFVQRFDENLTLKNLFQP